MVRSYGLILCSAVTAALLFAGCRASSGATAGGLSTGSTTNGTMSSSGGATQGVGTATGIPTTTGTASSSSSGPLFDVAMGMDGGGGATPTCSPDLRQVLDGVTGEVVEDCPPDEGCLDGKCVPACDAAAGAKGSLGCEYIVPRPPMYDNQDPGSSVRGACHALLLVNGWATPAQITLQRGGQMLAGAAATRIPTGVGPATSYAPLPPEGIPPGQVAVLFLSHRPGAQHPNGNSMECPVTPAWIGDAAAHGTNPGVAFELGSDIPLTVYDILPYGGAPTVLASASLLFPIPSWGTNYLLSAPHGPFSAGWRWMQVVGEKDATEVTLLTSAQLISGGVDVPFPGVAKTYALDRGDVLQFMTKDEIGGTVLESTAPVAAFAGHTYLNVATEDSSGFPHDSAHQQLTHVQAMSSMHVGVGIPTRLASLQPESVLYRIVGVVDGTVLQYDPLPPTGAPGLLDAGEVVEFETRDRFIVRSQGSDFPFVLTQYMSGSILGSKSLDGCWYPIDGCDLGDTEWVHLVPPSQFLSNYSFFVDPTYGVAALTVVRKKGPEGFEDVFLDCLNDPVDGWMPVGAGGMFEVTYVELHRKGVGACATSQHHATSDAPFGITVWGVDQDVSYAYPAGGLASKQNSVVVPAG